MTTSPSITEVSKQPSRSALWVGLLITVLGLASNWLYFVNLPGQHILPWLNLLMPALGLLVLGFALWRAFFHPQRYGGRLLGAMFVLLCAPLVAVSVWGFFHARDVPSSSGTPRVGQKAPDFTLISATGESVSLHQMLSERITGPAVPKAVLLIFYRGYW